MPAPSRSEGRAARPSAALLFALGAFLCLSLGYLFSTPVWEAPDENTHFGYAAHLAQCGQVPLVLGTARDLGRSMADEEIQGNHPPLYYWLLALSLRAVGAADTLWSSHGNPAVTAGAENPASVFVFLHGTDESVPVSEGVRLLRWLRGWSVLCGLIGLVLTWRLGRAAFPDRPLVADVGVLLMACLPRYDWVLAALNPDALVVVFSHGCLLLLTLALAERRLSPRRGAAAGLLAGLAIHSKFTTLFLPALVVGVLVFAWWHWEAAFRAEGLPAPERAARRAALRRSILATLGALLLSCSWTLVRNWQLYGSPLALDVQRAAFPGLLLDPARRWEWVLTELPVQMLTSLLGWFGWFTLPPPLWIVRVGQLVLLAAFLGGVLSWRSGRRSSARFLALVVLLVVGQIVAINLRQTAADGRYLFPVLGPLLLLVAAGLAELLERLPTAWRGRVLPALALLPVAAGSTMLFAHFRPAFRVELAPAPPGHSSLTTGVARAPRLPQITLLSPAQGAEVELPPVFRWLPPDVPAPRRYSLYLLRADGRVILGTHEQADIELSSERWAIPPAIWAELPNGETLSWKVRLIPDEPLRSADQACESPRFDFVKRGVRPGG
ncbi:MAG: DUF2142 domain-containing protein [Planctomycetota bacterium]